MSLGDQFQTIIYYEDTGDIREILPNQYVKSRKALNRYLGLPESIGIKFFYISGYFPLQKEDFKVELGGKNKSPKLRTLEGKDASLIFAQREAEHLLNTYTGIEYVFEGGMGDYMDQANVAIQMHRDYPDKTFRVTVEHENRRQALELLDGWEGIEWGSDERPSVKRLGKVEMKDITNIQGWVPVGKIGAYSAIGGLKKTAPQARILVPPAGEKKAKKLIQEHTKPKNPSLIILHTVSGPANTKSIPPATVIELLSPLLSDKNIVMAHIGGAGEETVDHPQIISLQGKLPWEEVFAVMSIASACICIDSAIMHIAQHLPIPTISFWGPTDPVNIIGDNPGITTIRSTADCKGCNLWNCGKTDCMAQFDVVEVMAAFETLTGAK